MSNRRITAAILAGGLGTRLRSVVEDRPKVLAPVGGRPFLLHLLDQLAEAGTREVVLLTGYRGELIHEALGETYRDMRLRYSREQTPLGTGGALRAALTLLDTPTVLLLNGDSYFDLDLTALGFAHEQRDAQVTLSLTRVEDTSRYGRVEVDRLDRVRGFAEKQVSNGPGWINAGVYLLERSLIAAIPHDRTLSLERELMPRWLERERVFGHRQQGRFLDIGTPESYASAEAFFAEEQCPAVGRG